MKKIIFAIIALFALCSLAMAGTIRPTGMNQKDLYNLLSKIVTMVNELKADHNAVVVTNRAAFGAYSSTVKVLNTTSTDLSLTQ